jgi:hypothetical protein
MVHIDFITALIASVVSMILAFVWYSPFLFGNLWIKLTQNKNAKMPMSKMFFALINTFIQAVFLHIIVSYMGATSFWDGVIVGFIVWLGFVATTQFSGVLWGKKPFALYLLDNGFWLISFIVMGGILAG